MYIIDIIDGEEITLQDNGDITFKAKAAVDTDGSGPLHGDPCAQKDTSLHFEGKALNADEDIYIVLPPQVISGVKPMVLGCQAFVINGKNNLKTAAVVGDIGPHRKIGEISVACAKALGINPSPNTGGEDSHVIHYHVKPGVPAVVNGKTYTLQHYGQ
jgi:Fungal chitosanase of glycosyl hydrolase group 75